MQANIHPAYSQVEVTCSCGNKFTTGSTRGENFSIEICSECHPYYTGQQKLIDTEGRVDKFRNRFSAFGKHKKKA